MYERLPVRCLYTLPVIHGALDDGSNSVCEIYVGHVMKVLCKVCTLHCDVMCLLRYPYSGLLHVRWPAGLEVECLATLLHGNAKLSH